jgi:hypothetical protein
MAGDLSMVNSFLHSLKVVGSQVRYGVETTRQPSSHGDFHKFYAIMSG